TGKLDPLDVLDMPDWIPRLGRLRNRPHLKFFEEAVDSMLARRRAALARDPDGAPPDLLTLLLRATDPETGTSLSDVEIKANLVTFIIAGHETTSNALTFALYLLSQDSEARDRAEAEVDRAMPDGRLPQGYAEALPFTRAVIDEAMRLYPPAATISRQAAGPDRLGGLPIRAGTTVVVAPWVLHRHKLLWDDPTSFVPERFLPGNRGSIDRFAYLPFGAGPRVCIGASFALQEAVAVLATVTRGFRLTLAPGHEVMPVQRVALRSRGGMPMAVRRRSVSAS
ncbi:MAG: cytochrome P450, partial [Parafilimonas terrae]|nr:cytochrome P450 [Parafilimonas terrae]